MPDHPIVVVRNQHHDEKILGLMLLLVPLTGALDPPQLFFQLGMGSGAATGVAG
jgi:hypothetical protein